MKNTILPPIFLLLLLLQFSCKKDEISTETEIFGSWILKSISEPKSGKNDILPDNKIVVVEFTKDWLITEKYTNTSPTEYSFAFSGSNFDLEDATSIRIINLASATAGGYLFTIKKLDSKSLILEREQGASYQFSRK
jgi:hypothetical protein